MQTAPGHEGEAVASSSVSVQWRSEHLNRLGATGWHQAGYRGRGMKVAILDSGFRGYRDHLGKALPAQVTARSFRKDSNLEARDSQHGILCGEVVHALAPEAQLLFANWQPGRPETFLKAVRWARAQGAQIISCSCIMPGWSDGEGGGSVHEELARILGSGKEPGDVLFFACAGNTAQRHWHGLFRDGGEGIHDWGKGQTDNLLTPWGPEQVSVALYAPAGARYELGVCEPATGKEVARSAARGGLDRTTTVVRFRPRAGKRYSVRVRLVGGKAGPFHLVALHSGLQWISARGSICFPADGKSVLAVGAADHEGARCAYSACGPNSALPKPDLVAPVPFASLWRARPFGGTSAATPQAAALAALSWSRHPHWTADRARNALRRAAQDLGPSGHDWDTGYGMICLPPGLVGARAGR